MGRLLFEEPDESESINDLAKQEPVDEFDTLFPDITPAETKTVAQLFCLTEPEEATTASVASNNPYGIKPGNELVSL